MRTYDIYLGAELYATLYAHDDGQKVWTLAQWGDFWLDADKQRAIAWGVDHDPKETTLYHEGFRIQQRPQ